MKLFSEEIAKAKTVIWNGPMGVFEIKACAKGTFDIAHAIAANQGAKTIIGGGDSVKAVKKAGVGDKVVLHIVDALIAQYEGEQHTLLHYSAAVNELRFSADPVALDVLSLRELELQRQSGKLTPVASRSVTELFENAALLELGVNDPHKIQLETIP